MGVAAGILGGRTRLDQQLWVRSLIGASTSGWDTRYHAKAVMRLPPFTAVQRARNFGVRRGSPLLGWKREFWLAGGGPASRWGCGFFLL